MTSVRFASTSVEQQQFFSKVSLHNFLLLLRQMLSTISKNRVIEQIEEMFYYFEHYNTKHLH